MILSLLQLNANGDNFWDKLVPYLSTHDFDVLNLQELTGKDTISGILNSKKDTFKELQNLLQYKYQGELVITQRYTSSPDSYIGNAIFFKKTFSLIEKKEIILSEFGRPYPSELNTFEGTGRALLHLKLEKEGKTLSILNTHLAWAHTSKEEPHQTNQGEILLNYLQTVHHPFILAGDFNLDPQQPLIQKLSKLARNLTVEHHIQTTLNPRTHYAKQLFPPGIAVDYIFVSPDITVKDFSVVEEDISDHLGLITEIVL